MVTYVVASKSNQPYLAEVTKTHIIINQMFAVLNFGRIFGEELS